MMNRWKVPRFVMRGGPLALVVGLGCGPTRGDAEEGDGSGDGSSGAPATACMPAAGAEAGIIRAIDGGYRIEFGAYDFGDVTFGCDAEPPCVGPYGRHTQLVIRTPVATPVGEYSGAAGTMSGTERWCGCCNGEGGEIDPSWDLTDPIDDGVMQIDGADTTCVSGSWAASSMATSPSAFVLQWCP